MRCGGGGNGDGGGDGGVKSNTSTPPKKNKKRQTSKWSGNPPSTTWVASQRGKCPTDSASPRKKERKEEKHQKVNARCAEKKQLTVGVTQYLLVALKVHNLALKTCFCVCVLNRATSAEMYQSAPFVAGYQHGCSAHMGCAFSSTTIGLGDPTDQVTEHCRKWRRKARP